MSKNIFVMVPRCFLLAMLLLTPCLSQYMDEGTRADITFNENNDRFDVSNIIQEQNRALQNQRTELELDSRRSISGKRPLIELLRNSRQRNLRNHEEDPLEQLDELNGDGNRDLESQDPSFRGEESKTINLNNFLRDELEDINTMKAKVKATRENMQDFVWKRLREGAKTRNGRRVETNAENELLLHHEVPIRLKMNGYLLARSSGKMRFVR